MTMFNKIVKEFQWGQHTVRMETGEVAMSEAGLGRIKHPARPSARVQERNVGQLA